MQPEQIVRKILEGRGVVSEEAVLEFLSGKPQLTYDPLLLPGAEEGAGFLLEALSRGDRICVYGDYDADGICGTALLVLFLREAARFVFQGAGQDDGQGRTQAVVTYYIPSRMDEGYGLNKGALRTIKDNGADVVVTVDCGSVSAAEAAYAKEIGLDILITDHHDPDPAQLPDCLLINPKVTVGGAAGYPFEKLSGAGVAFKLCSALQRRMENGAGAGAGAGAGLRKILHSMVDLVCVATIADVMPLIDENRTFVKYGLSLLRRGTRPAFRKLCEACEVAPEKISVREIAFGVAPRLNALGRMGDASEGVEFFLAESQERINSIAARMERMNTERRNMQEICFNDCMGIYEAGLDAQGKPRHMFLLLKPEISHEGVSGIVAGKVREATGLPCAVLSESREEKGLLKGSARSDGGLNLIDLLRAHRELFERLGGHAAAAGFSIRAENEDILRETLSGELAAMAAENPGLLDGPEGPELEIGLSDIGFPLAEALEGLAPFGVGNPKPKLSVLTAAAAITGLRFMGQGKKHLQFTAGGVDCVFFGGGETVFPEAGGLMLIGCPEINEWNGNRSARLAVERICVL